jgi:hypothetical protein
LPDFIKPVLISGRVFLFPFPITIRQPADKPANRWMGEYVVARFSRKGISKVIFLPQIRRLLTANRDLIICESAEYNIHEKLI